MLRIKFSDVFGSLQISKVLQMVCVGTGSGIAITGIRAEQLGIEIPVLCEGDKLSVVSVLFLFGVEVTEVDGF